MSTITSSASTLGRSEIEQMVRAALRRRSVATPQAAAPMLPDGSDGGNPCGILLKLTDGTIYHAADTGLFYDMKLIGEDGIDLAILPIGDNFTMGPDDALKAVKLIEPRRVIPDHYDTWPLIAQDAAAWAERVRAETSTEPLVLQPGDSCELGE